MNLESLIANLNMITPNHMFRKQDLLHEFLQNMLKKMDDLDSPFKLVSILVLIMDYRRLNENSLTEGSKG